MKRKKLYQIELRNYGEVVYSHETLDVNDAKSIYEKLKKCLNCAVVLFVDGSLIPMMKADRTMGYKEKFQ